MRSSDGDGWTGRRERKTGGLGYEGRGIGVLLSLTLGTQLRFRPGGARPRPRTRHDIAALAAPTAPRDTGYVVGDWGRRGDPTGEQVGRGVGKVGSQG